MIPSWDQAFYATAARWAVISSSGSGEQKDERLSLRGPAAPVRLFGAQSLGLLALELLTSHLAADQAGEAQDGFVDTAVSHDGGISRAKHLDPNLFVPCRHISCPSPNRLFDMERT
jgi:hypothetical protein